jgi:hypothetical protein
MNTAQESGAYLGGIGVMLEASDVCPSCGQVHEGRRFGLKHLTPRECPRVVMGSFPLVSLPSLPEESPLKVPVARPPTGPRARDPEPPLTATSLMGGSPDVSRARVDPSRSRTLGVPWLPPPDLGEVV